MSRAGSTGEPSSAVTAIEPGTDLGDLVVLEHEELAGEPEDRRHVRGEEGRAVADPHQQRRDPAGGHDELRIVRVDHRDGKGPAYPGQRGPQGTGESTVGVGGEPVLDQVGEDLGVGLRLEPVTVRDQLVGQLHVVLDDPVVDEREAARAVEERMGVLLARAAVGRPAGVADAGGRTTGRALRTLGEVVEGPGAVGGPGTPDPVFGCADQGDACRVVAPVLEPCEAVEEHPEHRIRIGQLAIRGARRGDADDPAHGFEG